MSLVQVREHIEQRLPGRLMEALYNLARTYQEKGVRLFIFGSFARSQDRPASDLDLGVLWTKERSPRIFSELYRDVQELPTIRKIDLVDMELVDRAFKDKALQEAVMLLKEAGTYE